MLNVRLVPQSLVLSIERLQVARVLQHGCSNGRDNCQHVQVPHIEANAFAAALQIDESKRAIEGDKRSRHG